jgi:predicted DNA-binding protein
MGRPALGNIGTHVRLSAEAMARIDALVGQKRRAQFIREAVEAELARRERKD